MQDQDRAAMIDTLKAEIPYLRERYGVDRLALFGSFARNQATEESDIDILVWLSKPLGYAFIGLAQYLEEKLGRRVDLLTAASMERCSADPRRAHIARDIQESLIHVETEA